MASAAKYRTQHVAQTPRGFRVRSKRAGKHVLRVAFPPGPRKRGSDQVVEILHPKGENPKKCNPGQLLLLGANPRKRKAGKKRKANFSNHKPGCGCVFCKRNPKRTPTGVIYEGKHYKSGAPHRGDVARQLKAARFLRQKSGKSRAAVKVLYNPKRKRNASSDGEAVQLFEKFTGRAPSRITTAHVPCTMPSSLTQLGALEELEVKLPFNGKKVIITFEKDGVKLAANPAGTQLYLVGGNQNLDSMLDQFGSDRSKDIVDLGEAIKVTYVARKAADGNELISYYHKLGEESGVRPQAFYNKLEKQISLAGGNYRVKAPGIID